MKAIFIRELRSYFTTALGYVFLGFSLLLSGLFVSYNVAYSYGDVSSVLVNMSIVLLFLIPILTMKLIAQEKATKTDQLLFTSPVSKTEIVLAKYFAAVAVFVITALCMAVYPIVLSFFGKIPFGKTVAAYIGYILMGSSWIALGVFCSSITENQVISAVVGFAILLILWLLDTFANIFNSQVVVNIVSWIVVTARYEKFSTGIFTLADILYFLSFSAIFLYFAILKVKGPMNFSKQWKNQTIFAMAFVVGLLAVNVGVSYLIDNYDTHLKFDISQDKVYTLSKESKEIVKNLQDDVKFYYFYPVSQKDEIVSSFVHNYSVLSSKLTLQEVDPTTDLALANKYGITVYEEGQSLNNTIIVESGEKWTTVYSDDLYAADYNSGVQTFQGENVLTSAIMNVTTQNEITVGISTGHKELNTLASSFLKDAQLMMETQDINLLSGSIPENVKLIMIVCPTIDFTEAEITLLNNFILAGNGVQVYFDYTMPTLTNLQNYLETNWGIGVTSKLGWENNSQNIYLPANSTQNPGYYLMPNVAQHDINGPLASRGYSIVTPFVRLLTKTATENATVESLLNTSDGAWSLNFITGEEAQERGDVSVISTRVEEGVENATVIVTGTSGILSTQFMAYNKDFILNSINYQAKNNNQIMVRPKTVAEYTLVINQATSRWLFWSFLSIMPLMCLAMGIVVCTRRARQL